LLALLITGKVPGWMEAAFYIFVILTVAGLIAFLMTRGSGWHALAEKYPERMPYTGQLRRCRTIQMTAVDSNLSLATRFSGGIVSVGVTRDALYIVAPSVVRFLFPTIQLPWTSIASAKPFEAPGWVKPIVNPGTAIQIQAEYDSGFSGDFIELETTAPKTCIRLPLYAIEGARSYLPLS
jgi:hypothetical protein